MRLISTCKAAIAALLFGCCATQATAASFVGPRDDFRDETIYFVMTTRFYDGDKSNKRARWLPCTSLMGWEEPHPGGPRR